MSEYTPTTEPSMEDIRADWVLAVTRHHDSYTTGRTMASVQELYGDLFDRVIAAHDAEVRAALEAQPRPRIRAVIEANIGNAINPHSWRCENPDRFPGYCRCVDEITDEVVAALTEPVPDTRSEGNADE